MSHQEYVLGIDVGTQSVRAALIEPGGQTKVFGVAELKTRYPNPGWAEQDPDDWWAAIRQAVGNAHGLHRVVLAKLPA